MTVLCRSLFGSTLCQHSLLQKSQRPSQEWNGDNKSVGGGVRERKIDFQKGYRIYYAIDGENLVLLFWGGTKKRQQKDVDKAKQMWAEYKARKRKLAIEETKTAAEKKPKPRRKK